MFPLLLCCSLQSRFSFDDAILDARVRVEMTTGTVHEGAVFAMYQPQGCFVVETPAGAPQGRATYLTINTQYVKSVKVLAAAPDTGEASGTVPLPFDPSAVKLAATQRTAHQLGQMSTKTFANMNANATAVFDDIHKTMPCEWLADTPPSISVLGETVARVKKVLEKVLTKIGAG
ncbi:hypothetical protein EMIHUDRAFT_236593 [Emiliania huxleyi CCMP1516]|uniref:LSM12 anticodon-binding domain-containing protein n=2 Tax=Emiliania huxleyi TaxID=2903 RepID=A0A0D3JT46_EMIH1|nr:hypothetical protein EMIHUDRAFT_236593 [Emiliania huxleyi CCMP1516]EOD26681.1 hypothetical protein EMIHUDRAFT_236593 [Emiliania huxleyi CCMP1516]|eukprot:XP_005779110.1 hypothetical protein EMIHUDRAFT_236593 [Emiliania huxleyi CCMP1516]